MRAVSEPAFSRALSCRAVRSASASLPFEPIWRMSFSSRPELGLGPFGLAQGRFQGLEDILLFVGQSQHLLLVRLPGLLLLGDEGPVPLHGGVMLAAEDLDAGVNVVPGLLVAADLLVEGGEPGAFLIDAGGVDVLVPGLLAELPPERRLLLLFLPQPGLDPEAGHVAAGAGKERADAAAEVLVAEEDEGDEEQDDEEKEPQQPEGQSFGNADGDLRLEGRVHAPIMAYLYCWNKRTSVSLVMSSDWRKRIMPLRSMMIVAGMKSPGS